jgi:hypothetical protein
MATKHATHLKLNHDQNPFDSPGLSVNSVADTESGNTSGQDEFHLERYSEGLKWDEERRTPGQHKPASQLSKRVREPSPRKRPRPGLNIITDFSKPVERPFADGVVMDEIKAHRPEVGQRPRPIARSHTVEHVRAKPQPPQSEGPAFVNLNDLLDLRKKEKKQRSSPKAATKSRIPDILSNTKERPPPAYSSRNLDYSTQSRSVQPNDAYQRQDKGAYDSGPNRRKQEARSPSDSSIVIGISVPESDVESHKPQSEASSALTMQTPSTPTIVVTPADATASWNLSKHTYDAARRRRPASSLYSQATAYVAQFNTSTDNPPVPSIPQVLTKSKKDAENTLPRRSVDSWESVDARRRRAYSADTIFDEDESEGTNRPRSSSAESKLAILPSSVDSARPRSKGWWNIMMSPMLSRAGTLMSRKSPAAKDPIPPIPSLSAAQEKARYAEELNEKSSPAIDSHGISQDGDLNTKRASTWSQWSNWEKERDQAKEPTKSAEAADTNSSRGHKGQDSAATLQFMMRPSPVTQGLAAEYFHACAVDSRSATPYFECQNHSCVEMLPKLASTSVATTITKAVGTTNPSESRGLVEQSCSSSPPASSDKHFRSDSEATIIDDEPAEISPVVRKAEVAAKSKALPVSNPEIAEPSDPNGSELCGNQSKEVESLVNANKSVTLPEYSSPRPGITRFPRHVATTAGSRLPPASPGPLSPEMQRAMASQGAIPMADVHHPPPAPPAPTFITNYTIYPELVSRPNVVPVSLADIDPPNKARQTTEAKRRDLEKEDATARKVGGLWRGRGCIPKNGCFGRGGPEGRKRRRWYVVLTVGLVLMIVASIVLATQLTRKGNATPVQSQWLNLTGFPPMPTGISTVARPDAAVENSGCVNLNTLWSCAVPKEDQASIAPNDPDQPNFRMEISFRNGTVPANETNVVSNSTQSKRSISNIHGILRQRQNDPFTNEIFTPNPAAPAPAEQVFLGNTTDNITVPFDGEATPFFITFLSTSPVLPAAFDNTSATGSRFRSRQTSNSSNDITSGIPAPDIGSDGTAAQANLLPDAPLPYSQPVRLYNRGQSTEHYGFYSYFDRAIFLTNTTVVANDETGPSQDQNGGSTKAQANWRCTFSQTRFLVRIWTNAEFGATLLNGGPTIFPGGTGSSSTSAQANSTATDFTPPGSFPYPISITLDRHGGDMNKKGAYCYKMDPSGNGDIIVDSTSPQVVAENRGAGGVAVNPAPSKLTLASGGNADGSGFNSSAGGIDGGTGGCSCEWRNWQGNGNGNV